MWNSPTPTNTSKILLQFSQKINWNLAEELFFFFGPRHTACRILVPQPGIEPTPPTVEVQSLNHWTTREVPRTSVQPKLQERSPCNWVGQKKRHQVGICAPGRDLKGREGPHGQPLTLGSKQVEPQSVRPSPGILRRGD